MSRTLAKQSPLAPRAPPYHVRVVVTHVDPLASGEPGLVLKYLLHEAQVASISVVKQSADRGESESLPVPPPTPPSAEHSRAWANLSVSASLPTNNRRGEGKRQEGQRGKGTQENVTTKIKKETGTPTEDSKNPVGV